MRVKRTTNACESNIHTLMVRLVFEARVFHSQRAFKFWSQCLQVRNLALKETYPTRKTSMRATAPQTQSADPCADIAESWPAHDVSKAHLHCSHPRTRSAARPPSGDRPAASPRARRWLRSSPRRPHARCAGASNLILATTTCERRRGDPRRRYDTTHPAPQDPPR